MSITLSKRELICAVTAIIMLVLASVPAKAQIVVKNEDVTFKFGILVQLWGDWTQDSTAGVQGYQQNLYIRRARLMMSGDIGKDISFFFDTDTPNLGKTPKSLTSGFVLQDAVLEWKPTKVFQVNGGMMFVPFSRNEMQSPASYYTVDHSAFASVDTSPTQSVSQRDLGLGAKGFLLKDHLLYRMGVFQGERDPNARNSLRTSAYLQYDFFDTETGYSYMGTALGTKKILAIDVGGEKQGAFRGFSANLACDQPVNGGDEIGGQFQYYHYDGRQKFTAIPDQNDWFVEGAYYIHQAKAQPFVKFEQQNFVAAANAAKDIHRVGTGVNYYVHGQNLKWTLQYNRLLPQNGSPLKASNEVTMQLQLFYF